jgi:microcystin-dependent protein
MSDPFLAEIRTFPFNFAPLGWALCDGQILSISQNAALFSLVGTNYGGNGTSNFGLPNLQGNVAVCAGQGPGLSLYAVGETGGTPTVTLLEAENPRHSHLVEATNKQGDSASPSGELYGKSTVVNTPTNTAINTYAKVTTPPNVELNLNALGVAGGSLAHNNMMPSLVISFCIALSGIFPQRG